MSRFTRIVVIVSIVAAGVFETTLAAREWPPLAVAAGAALAAGVLCGRVFPKGAPALALAYGYVAPAMFTAVLGRFRLGYLTVWLAALLGALLADRPLRGWALEPKWRWPLVTWALLLSASWPWLALRELDFNPALLSEGRGLATSMAGGLPSEAVEAILRSAVAQGIGILVFDWLWARSQDEGRGLAPQVSVTLAAGAALACALGAYQGFFDLTFLTVGSWAALGRAAGSLADANAFGMLAALWTAGFAGLALRARRRAERMFFGGCWVLAWLGVWASASRTAFSAALLAGCLLGVQAFSALSSQAARRRLVVGAGAVFLAGLAFFAVVPSRSEGPLRRAFSSLPAPTVRNAGRLLSALWQRNYYGTAAVIMIREHPLVGVGIGAFNTLSPDYTYLAGSRETFDNAQNWYRHQLAELGLVGGAGWITWVGLFGWTLLRTRGGPDERLLAAAVKGGLLAFGAVSLFGVPAQNPAVALTFWVFAFWFLSLVCRSDQKGTVASKDSRRAWLWGTVWLVVFGHVAGTWSVARHELRVTERARRIGWAYAYGFYDLERTPDGQAFRWTARKAVAVVPVNRGRIPLIVWAAHPDKAMRPVDVRVWVDNALVISLSLRDSSPVMRDVLVGDSVPRVVLRVSVDHTWRPSDFGSRDTRELGVAIAGPWMEG